MPILVWHLGGNNIDKNSMFSLFYFEKSYLLLCRSFQIMSHSWGRAVPITYRIKLHRLLQVFDCRLVACSQTWEHRFKGSATLSGFPYHTSSDSLHVCSLPGFCSLSHLLWVLCTYFNSWMAVGSEAPQPHSDPSIPCCGVSRRNTRSHLGMKEKTLSSLCRGRLALRLPDCRHRHVADGRALI